MSYVGRELNPRETFLDLVPQLGCVVNWGSHGGLGGLMSGLQGEDWSQTWFLLPGDLGTCHVLVASVSLFLK